MAERDAFHRESWESTDPGLQSQLRRLMNNKRILKGLRSDTRAAFPFNLPLRDVRVRSGVASRKEAGRARVHARRMTAGGIDHVTIGERYGPPGVEPYDVESLPNRQPPRERPRRLPFQDPPGPLLERGSPS